MCLFNSFLALKLAWQSGYSQRNLDSTITASSTSPNCFSSSALGSIVGEKEREKSVLLNVKISGGQPLSLSGEGSNRSHGLRNREISLCPINSDGVYMQRDNRAFKWAHFLTVVMSSSGVVSVDMVVVEREESRASHEMESSDSLSMSTRGFVISS